MEGLDLPGGRVMLPVEIADEVRFPFSKGTDRMRFSACKRIRGETNGDVTVPAGELKCPFEKPFMAVMQGVKRAPYHNLHAVGTLISYDIMRMDAGVVGCPLYVAPNATVIGDVTLTAKVSIWFGAVVRADKDRIVIGEGSNIQDNCVVHTSAGHPVIIGSHVSVGHGAVLHGCTLSDRVLVGMGAIILNGAVIGENSVIGAGAVVTEGMAVPPLSVVVGVPGRVIKQVTEEQKQHIVRNAASYVELAAEYAHG